MVHLAGLFGWAGTFKLGCLLANFVFFVCLLGFRFPKALRLCVAFP
jgi:hypothetical protein